MGSTAMGQTVTVTTDNGDMPTYLAVPEGEGPWPGVVVIHDALGMTTDLRNQADWLASQGFLAAAPDLYHRGPRLRCMFSTIRDALRREGQSFRDLEATRAYLTAHPSCTGRVGVIGFCMGGGFAVLLAAGWGYDVSSVNYGGVGSDATEYLAESCPIVASYGGRDRGLAKAPHQLKEALSAARVDHDIRIYPSAGHSFLNDHVEKEVPLWARLAGGLTVSAYDPRAAEDARRRIAAFFHTHLD